MKTFKIEWRLKGPQLPFQDIPYESWSIEEHANLRMKAYWEKLGFPLEFRVIEALPHESQQLPLAAQ